MTPALGVTVTRSLHGPGYPLTASWLPAPHRAVLAARADVKKVLTRLEREMLESQLLTVTRCYCYPLLLLPAFNRYFR